MVTPLEQKSTNETINVRKHKLFEEFGIRTKLVGENADRKAWRAHWRKEIKKRSAKVDLAKHAVLVAKRQVSEARVACEQTIVVGIECTSDVDQTVSNHTLQAFALVGPVETHYIKRSQNVVKVLLPLLQ